jgi:hypothetical protein
VRVEYEQTRRGYQRKGFAASRGGMQFPVSPAAVKPASQRFAQVVEVPAVARNVRFHSGALPERYRAALQDVR